MENHIAHGKEECRWCDSCGTLILGKKCSCGKETRTFEINSPGDIRPCMGDGVELIQKLFLKFFGTFEPLRNKMIFLNKVPGEDRTDEIIAHGTVIGVLRYELSDKKYHLDIRQGGAEIFNPFAKKNIVSFGGISGHLKGKSISGENIKDIIGEFEKGEPLILRKGNKIGAGTALCGSSEISDSEKAVKIKDLDNPSGLSLSPDSGKQKFVKANRQNILNRESSAISDIVSFVKGKNVPVTSSFSGGKDSLVSTSIALKALKKLDLLFVNTGLEFPETSQYVTQFSKKHSLRLLEAKAENSFWKNVETFGPPAKDFRWCCKVCKLGPITDLISKQYPKGTITVEGNRMLESFSRSKIGFVSKNPFVPNQTTLNPIRAWNAAEVWCYIWTYDLDYNPLYDRDFERIGCYLCASCLASEWENTERIHPELGKKWEKFLYSYAEERNLPKEFVDMGFWRWKVLPPKMVKLAEGLNLKTEAAATKDPKMKMLKGASSCAAGGYSVEAVATIPRNRDFSCVEDALRTVGEVKYSSEFEIALVKTKTGTAKLFGGGQISVVSNSLDGAKSLFDRSAKALLRAQMCTSCGICAKNCKHHAITIKNGLHVDGRKCISCGQCEESCMVAHYFDKVVR